MDTEFDDVDRFYYPGGRSALHPGKRKYPCPTCKQPNRLTKRDLDKGYRCDACADRAEGYRAYGEYQVFFLIPQNPLFYMAGSLLARIATSLRMLALYLLIVYNDSSNQYFNKGECKMKRKNKPTSDYYTVNIPSDCASNPEERADLAFMALEERVRLFALPCSWTVINDDGENIRVRRTRHKIKRN